MKVLLIEDNKKLSSALKGFFRERGIEIFQAFTLEEGRKKLESGNFHAIVSDLKLPDGEGTELLPAAIELGIPFIVITAYGTIQMAVEAIKKGAYNFIQKPVDPEYLQIIIERAWKEKETEFGLLALRELEDRVKIIGNSSAFMDAIENARKAADSDITVLLLGETGSGKEVFARAIHSLSRRKSGPFVAINCASIPEPLLESELFGYEKGAFTGAIRTKLGRIELARGGTLFLDEIGEMSPSLQAKLLRVLEEKKFERLGGTREIEVDIRLIAATNKNIIDLVNTGKFRKDLYYRISAFPIRIPPLRERKEDIIPLSEYFLSNMARARGKTPPSLTEGAKKKLMSYSWPGNVRELKNVIERAFVLSGGQHITEAEIVLQQNEDVLDLSGTLEEAVNRAREWVERRKIQMAMKEANGEIREAAGVLGISPKTLYAKLKKYGIK